MLREPSTFKHFDDLLVELDLVIEQHGDDADKQPHRWLETIKEILARQGRKDIWEQLMRGVESELFTRPKRHQGAGDIYARRQAALRHLIDNLWSNKEAPQPVQAWAAGRGLALVS